MRSTPLALFLLFAVGACAGTHADEPPTGSSRQAIVNQGGPILANPAVTVVFASQQTRDVYSDAQAEDIRYIINGTPLYSVLNQYCDGANHCVSSGVMVEPKGAPYIVDGALWTHCGTTSNLCPSKRDFTDLIDRWIPQGSTNPNSAVLIVTPPNTLIPRLGPDDPGQSGSDRSNALGFHDVYERVEGNAHVTIPYAVVTQEHFGENVVHELAEMFTDPFWNTNPAFNPEIGDACGGLPATIDGIAVQKIWSNRDGRCVDFPRTWPSFGDGRALNAPDPTNGINDQSLSLANFPVNGGNLTVFGIDGSHAMMSMAMNRYDRWSSWWKPNTPDWISHIATFASSQRSDVVGIGGSGKLWWYFLGGWQSVSEFPAADIAIVAGGYGPATLFALGTDGVVHYQYLDSSGNPPTTDKWSTMDGLPGQATKMAVTNAGGRMQVAVVVDDRWPVYLARESVATYNGRFFFHNWNQWQDVSGVPEGGGGILALAIGHTGAASVGGERTAVFVGDGFHVWHGMDGAASYSDINASWTTFPEAMTEATTRLSVTNQSDGRLAVFGIGTGRRVWHVQQGNVQSDGSWSTPISLGGYVSEIVVGPQKGGRLEIFGVSEYDHTLVHAWQTVPQGPWSSTLR